MARSHPSLHDCGLTRKGEQQARDCGSRISREPELVVVSPLKRALSTALHLGLGEATLVAYPGIREVGSRIPENIARPVDELRRDRDLASLPRFEDVSFDLLGGTFPVADDDDEHTLQGFVNWLRSRPERHIWVVCHHNVIQWLLRDSLKGSRVPNCVPIPMALAGDGAFKPAHALRHA